MSDLDTMSLDDLYNHLKVYKSEVQKKSKPNSQNMAFISSAKHSSGNEEVNIASGSTASINVSTSSANIRVASISQDIACAYIASQSSGSQIKFEDINQIDEDDTEEMDIKWNMALLSMRADRFWKKTGKKISIQGTDVAWFDKSKVEYFNFHKMGHFARECRAPKSQDRGRKDNYRQGSKVEEQNPKALMAIDGTGLPEFKDDTVTEYSRPSPAIEGTSDDAQNRNPPITETEASPSTISPKPFIKFVKATDRSTEIKTAKDKTAKPAVKYAAMLGVKMRRSSPKNNYTHRSMPPRPAVHRPYRPPIRHVRPNMNVAQPQRTSFHKPAHSYNKRPFQRTSVVRSQYRSPRVPLVSRKFSTVNRKFPTANRKFPTGGTKFSTADMGNKGKAGSYQINIDEKGYWDNGCSRHMTGNISYLFDYEPFDRGYVSFGQGGCKITGQGTIKTECIVLGRDFKLLDDANVLLRTPRQHNMYSIDLNNIVPHKYLTCLVAKSSADECMLWHRRLGKQHKASCKSKLVNSVTKPLHTLHMDLFDPTSVSSINHKWYCLVVTDDFSRFTWTFFLKTKDETSGILRNFITEIENLKDLKVKIISKPYEESSSQVPECSGNLNSTASTFNPSAEKIESLTVESPIPTVSLPVPTACLNDSSETSSEARLVSKRVATQEETPSLDNTLSLTNMFDDILGDPEFPAKVYKVEKAMYGLHQAPRAWYGTLSKYLLTNGFQRGTIDQTLFIRRKRGDFILVQVYVDDIIFGSSNPQLCREFRALMHEKFQMSAMDIMFAVSSCARHQVTPKECHLHAVKRIFRYLKGYPKLGLWYPKESPFDLVTYSDSDYGGATQDRKSTTGGCKFLGRRLISWQCKKQTIVATSTTKAEYIAAAS
nr:putative ribonuclease H-like domain-containing protein [Tanacetum cinerariifolium]